MSQACPKPEKKIKQKKVINKVSPKELTKWKNKAITLAKKIVREYVNQCEWCGKKAVKFDGAHIIPVRFSATAADINNILCLCSGCHTLSGNSCHENPVLFTRWLDGYAPGRFEALWEKARQITDMTAADWKDQYLALKEKAIGLGVEP